MPNVPKSRRFKHRKDHDRSRQLAEKRGAKKDFKLPPETRDQENETSSDSSSSRPPTPASAADSVSLEINISSPDPSNSLPENILCESLSGSGGPSGSSNDPLQCDSATPEFKVPTFDPREFLSRASGDTGSSSSNTPDLSLLLDVKAKLEMFLKKDCCCLVDRDTIYVMFLSRTEDKVTQRQLSCTCDGSVSLKVHCAPIPITNYLSNVLPPVNLQSETVGHFVDRIVQIANNVRGFEICAGLSESEYKKAWSSCSGGVVDGNPYKECRYSETFRSHQCLKLVKPRQWKCTECNKLVKVLKRRSEFVAKEEIHPSTPNVLLTSEQKSSKLEEQRKVIKNTKRQLERIKMQQLIQKEGVNVYEELSCVFDEALQSEKLTPQQSLFFQQQLMAAKAKGPTGRRWHPVMIRFALSIIMKSPAAYNVLYESGMLYLPNKRTLFNYSHFKPVQDGVDFVILESISKEVMSQAQGENSYKKYHVLMFDEMHISKNLVLEKGTGKVLGYVALDEVQNELDALKQLLDGPQTKIEKPLASKVLTYMIKGVSNDIKSAIASYAVDILVKEQLFRWTWDVIQKLEVAGIAVVAFTCDGSPINRAFFKMHTPATPASKVVYDTVNKAAPDRNIYFVSDVPHLLKTIRNCFWSSTEKRYYNKANGKMMLRRRLQKNSEKIMWSTIVRLYNHQKGKSLRLAYKLNVQNVFLNNFSKMKVKYAAEVLSLTVAQLLENLNWDNTKETIEFIRRVNNFFDMLNGAHSTHGLKTRNCNLSPYRSDDDPRFKELDNFLDYLEDWKQDAISAANVTVDPTFNEGIEQNVHDPDAIDADNEEDRDEVTDPASTRQLSHQTLEGIAITVGGFKGAVKFLLGEGTQFINARVFCQDPIEQFFSKLRSRGGGSNNPNFSQVLHSQRSIHIQGQLGKAKNYAGNTEVEAESMILSNEPLPKRPRRELVKKN